MSYRHSIDTTEALAEWYSNKYLDMGGTWDTPSEDCDRHLDALMGTDKGGSLLDIGCGGGHFLARATRRCEFVVGIEISKIAIRYATKRLIHTKVRSGGVTWALVCTSIENPTLPIPTPSPDAQSTFDYITSIGSLEHIVDIDAALDNIHHLLKPSGRWYFYCPNELWVHEDQPNERTFTDEAWIDLFAKHDLVTLSHERQGDNTRFRGQRK